MLLSLEWLNNYIDLSDLTSEQIVDHLVDLGLEVESVVKKKPLDSRIVVAKVVEKKKHPHADKLSVCQVEVSSGNYVTIVCGAPNVRKNLKVACATIGSVLPNGLKIKQTKIREMVSEGMLCSEKELLISNDHHGIIEVDQDADVGTLINTALNIEDTILDVSITPNRGDCLSYIGIARDIAAKLKRTITIPTVSLPKNKLETKNFIELNVGENVACARFVALYVEGIKVIPSPLWLRKRIEASGLRSVNVIVDITNYVLLEQGQPIHAYDSRFIKGNQIQVLQDQKENVLTTLDSQKVKVVQDDLVIYDQNKPIGLAGIMGGKDSEVKDETTSIVIEVAHFSPVQIRKTAKRTGLHSEASHRFERGIDIENLEHVAKRVGSLIVDVMETYQIKAVVAGACVDYYPKKYVKRKIALRLDRVKQILGLRFITLETCLSHLVSLGCSLLDKEDERMLFEIPSWRHDLQKEIDLIEEVGRLEGFDSIPYEMPMMTIAPSKEDPFIEFMDRCRTCLASFGLTEVITYPFLSSNDVKRLNINEKQIFWPTVALENALNDEIPFLRTTLLPSLLQALIKNKHRGNVGAKLFEVSRGYFDAKAGKHKTFDADLKGYLRPERYQATKDRKNKPIERVFLSGVMDAFFVEKTWLREGKEADFFDGKKILEKFFNAFSIKHIKWKNNDQELFPFLHPKASASIFCNDKLLGYLGEVHPACLVSYGFDQKAVLAFELDLERLFEIIDNNVKFESQITKYPPVSRDLSFLMEDNISYDKISHAIKRHPKKKFLSDFYLFDLYRGASIQSTHKSMTFRFIFQSEKGTLTDAVIDKEVLSLVAWLKESLDIEQR